AEWDRAPEAAAELLEPFVTALKGKLSERKRAALLRLLVRLRAQAPVRDTSSDEPRPLIAPACTLPSDIGDALGLERADPGWAPTLRHILRATDGALAPELLHACEGATHTFKSLALFALVSECGPARAAELAEPASTELLRTSDTDLR